MIPLPRLAVALTLALSVAGCFRPLYGDQSSIGDSNVVDKMRSIEVDTVKTGGVSKRLPRIGGEVRNELIYQLTGGGAANTIEYRLTISMSASNLGVIADIASGRADAQVVGIDASYSLTETST